MSLFSLHITGPVFIEYGDHSIYSVIWIIIEEYNINSFSPLEHVRFVQVTSSFNFIFLLKYLRSLILFTSLIRLNKHA